MIENGMLSGAAAHRDSQAAAADAQARMAQIYAAEFLSAIDRNQPDARLDSGLVTDTLADIIILALYADDVAAKLIEGMSLLRNGKYEASCKVLLEWQYQIATLHGIRTAELRGAE